MSRRFLTQQRLGVSRGARGGGGGHFATITPSMSGSRNRTSLVISIMMTVSAIVSRETWQPTTTTRRTTNNSNQQPSALLLPALLPAARIRAGRWQGEQRGGLFAHPAKECSAANQREGPGVDKVVVTLRRQRGLGCGVLEGA